ncbi:MAG: gliding motility-associated C-terminal domain-containing protein [Bacteroidales bacterium]|nr:gliding motility-associated C-terminal domain-containing protein [Bacteroidales bacterium]
MKSIEELVRENLREATEEPPRQAWSRIESALGEANAAADEGTKADKRPTSWHFSKGAAIVSLVVLAVVVLAVVALWPGENAAHMVAANGEMPSQEESTSSRALQTAQAVESPAADHKQQQTTSGRPLARKNKPAVAEVAAIPSSAEENRHGSKLVNTDDLLGEISPTHNATPMNEHQDIPHQATGVDDYYATLTPEPKPTMSTKPNQEEKRNAVDTIEEPCLPTTAPNLITPNFDGVNDCFEVQPAVGYSVMHLRVYAASGKCVYENRNYDNLFCGEGVADGNYFFVLSAQGCPSVRRGVLVIKRK